MHRYLCEYQIRLEVNGLSDRGQAATMCTRIDVEDAQERCRHFIDRPITRGESGTALLLRYLLRFLAHLKIALRNAGRFCRTVAVRWNARMNPPNSLPLLWE